ncbi:hypothetical protein CORC01_00112, partial [Colletotrichum orchidophilum]
GIPGDRGVDIRDTAPISLVQSAAETRRCSSSARLGGMKHCNQRVAVCQKQHNHQRASVCHRRAPTARESFP